MQDGIVNGNSRNINIYQVINGNKQVINKFFPVTENNNGKKWLNTNLATQFRCIFLAYKIHTVPNYPR